MPPTEARSAPRTPESLVNDYISAYLAKDARAYLSLFAHDADYVDFAVQVHAKIAHLRDELASSFHREGFRPAVSLVLRLFRRHSCRAPGELHRQRQEW